MTDYVTEMMQTAGCKTHPRGCTNDDVNEYTGYISNDCEGDCEDCTWYDPDEYYPDFTAEKQLEIENLIINHQFLVYSFSKNKNIPQYTPFGYFKENNKIVCCAGASNSFKRVEAESRTQALAQLTTELMRAGELDKEKVKGILENAR